MTNIPLKRVTLLFILLLALCASPVQAQAPQPVVHAVMFWMAGCPHCEDVIANVLPPIHEKYGEQFDLVMIEVKSQQDIDLLYRVAESYKIPKEETGVPFLVIGDQTLVGSAEVRDQLPALVDDYLTRGGVDFPADPIFADLLPTTSPASPLTSDLPAATQAVPSSETESTPPVKEETRDNGFILAAVVMVFMVVTILFALFSLLTGKPYFQAAWMDIAIPWVALIGLGVAVYLSYVETQSVKAICGPIGDCNAVQSSSYARLWGILPIGVLGAFGYIAILAAWWVGKNKWGWVSQYAPVALFGMALFGTIFSVYLTYLEIYVIKAVCIWCVSSAVIIALLLWFSLHSALNAFASSEEDIDL